LHDRTCARELLEDGVDVDAAVLGRVRPEPSRSLLQLALAANAVAAPGLVPRDRDVDEPLEEVALFGCRRAPGVLELLVGGEELACADQVEPARELLRLRP
jgi:hypothetical protein